MAQHTRFTTLCYGFSRKDGLPCNTELFASHTSGDLVVDLPAQKVVATGDIITTNRSEDNPFIHPDKNGSTAGWIANAKGMARLDADTYVVGHGDVLKKADMEERAKRLEERRSKIAAMVKDGKSLDQIKAALPEAPAPPPPVPPVGAAAAADRNRLLPTWPIRN